MGKNIASSLTKYQFKVFFFQHVSCTSIPSFIFFIFLFLFLVYLFIVVFNYNLQITVFLMYLFIYLFFSVRASSKYACNCKLLSN